MYKKFEKAYEKSTKEIIAIFLFSVFIFGLFFSSALNTNIHGDAKFHTYYSLKSIDLGFLVREQPHRIYDFEDGRPRYMPISYPLTSESLFSVLYLFGDELALKLYAPVFAVFIFILVYLCVREIGLAESLFVATGSTLAISERLFMTPLMEPMLVIVLLASIFCLKKYFIKNKISYLYLAAIFLGSAASMKQQGLISALYISFFIFCFFVAKLYKNKSKGKIIINLIIFLLLVITIPIPAINDQIQRTGTFAYSPGRTEIPGKTPFYSIIQPLLSSRFQTDPNAMEAISQTIYYNRRKDSLFDKVQSFFLSPVLYYKSKEISYFLPMDVSLFLFIIAMFMLAAVDEFKNKKLGAFKILLIYVSGFEIATSFLLKTPINQYHILGIIVTSMLVFSTIFYTLKSLKRAYIFTFAVFLIYIVTNYNKLMLPLWSSSGREDTYHIEGYKKLGDYVKQYTSQDAIFLAPETSFRYYADRDTIWINESVGHLVREVIYSTDDKEAASKLKNALNVDYVVINRAQLSRFGVNDYLPENGLVSIIDNSTYFTKMYDPFDDGEIILYKVTL